MAGSNEGDFDESLAALFQRARGQNKERAVARHSKAKEPIVEHHKEDEDDHCKTNFGSSSALESSEATLFKIAREDEENKATAQCNDKEAEQNVEKLIALLNGYANWEIRGLLISILKGGKSEALKERLIGKEQDTLITEEASTTSEEDGGASLSSKTSSNKATDASKGGSAGETSTPARRRSRSIDGLARIDDGNDGLDKKESLRSNALDISRRSASGRASSRGKKPRPRSLSSERILGSGSEHSSRRSRDAGSSRQASILAKRKELDKMKVASTGTARVARRNSLSPSRTSHQSRTETKPPIKHHSPRHSPRMARPKSGSADNLLGPRMARAKSGSAENLLGLGSSSYHARRPRGNKNATFNNHVLGVSLHGTNSDKVPCSSSLGIRPHRQHSDSEKRPPLARNSSGSHSFDETMQSPPPEDESQVGFLQFQPDKDEKSQIATSFKHSVKVNALVDELRASAHNPINIMIDKSAKDDECPERKKKRLGFLRGRKKKTQKESISNVVAESESSEASNDSDEESFQ